MLGAADREPGHKADKGGQTEAHRDLDRVVGGQRFEHDFGKCPRFRIAWVRADCHQRGKGA